MNPYTGLALIDDPAVITVQINNEDSAIKGTMETDQREEMQPYRDEVQNRFNSFLLMKYGTRERLKEAWTFEGKCALGEEEDPEKGTVQEPQVISISRNATLWENGKKMKVRPAMLILWNLALR